MILEFLHGGHADKLLLSTDYNGLRSEARPGYASTLVAFAPKLRQAGVDDETLRMILRDNPRRFLAFVPKMKWLVRIVTDVRAGRNSERRL